MELETMTVGTYASEFDILTCITIIPQEELKELNKITKYLFESTREQPQQLGVKILERKSCFEVSLTFCTTFLFKAFSNETAMGRETKKPK